MDEMINDALSEEELAEQARIRREKLQKLTDEGIYKMVIETTANSSFHGRLEYPVDLTDKILITDLKVSIPAQQWTGEALTPTVTVKYKNKTVSR